MRLREFASGELILVLHIIDLMFGATELLTIIWFCMNSGSLAKCELCSRIFLKLMLLVAGWYGIVRTSGLECLGR